MQGRVSLLIGCLSLVLAGCGSNESVRHSDFNELTAAWVARIHIDGSAHGVDKTSIVHNGREILSIVGSARFSVGPDGPRIDATTEVQAIDGRPPSRGLIALPDATYIRLSSDLAQAAGRPFFKLDPNRTDPFSLSFTAIARGTRAIGSRLFCMTELGKAEIADVARGELDGVPVMSYRINVDLATGSTVPTDTEFYRRLGFTDVQAVLDFDRDDRMLRCTVDQVLPGGNGRVFVQQRLSRFGEPVHITPPPADEVTTELPTSY